MFKKKGKITFFRNQKTNLDYNSAAQTQAKLQVRSAAATPILKWLQTKGQTLKKPPIQNAYDIL